MSSAVTITWEDIKKFIAEGKLDKLARSPEVAERYAVFKKQLHDEGSDLVTHILTERLNWDVEELEKLNMLTYATDDDKIRALFREKSTLKILPNEFPYNLESNVSHILIWSKIYIPLFQLKTAGKSSNEDYMASINPAVKLASSRKVFG